MTKQKLHASFKIFKRNKRASKAAVLIRAVLIHVAVLETKHTIRQDPTCNSSGSNMQTVAYGWGIK